MNADPLLSAGSVRFLEAGCSITIATGDGDLEPDGAVAWAARVRADRSRVTVFLHADAARALLRNLEAHPAIAVLFERPSDHHACQVKGRYLSSRRARASERADVERQVEGFAAELEAIGIPRELTGSWEVWPCVALELEVTALFEQTPGPGAGEPLR